MDYLPQIMDKSNHLNDSKPFVINENVIKRQKYRQMGLFRFFLNEWTNHQTKRYYKRIFLIKLRDFSDYSIMVGFPFITHHNFHDFTRLDKLFIYRC